MEYLQYMHSGELLGSPKAVLNLIINGIPSILKSKDGTLEPEKF